MKLVDGFKIRLVMVVFGLTLIYFVVPAQAQVLLSDNFNDGNYDGWTVIDGSWSAADGVLRGKKTGWSNPPTIETSLSLDSTTVTIEFDTYLRTSFCRGPTVCLKNANNDVILGITMEHCPFNPTHFIRGTVLGASETYSWSADNEWHNLRLVADGGKFDVYLDATKIIQDIVYGDTTTYLTATTLWIGGWEHETTGCAYDNIIVTSTVPSPPPEPVVFDTGFRPSVHGFDFANWGLIGDWYGHCVGMTFAAFNYFRLEIDPASCPEWINKLYIEWLQLRYLGETAFQNVVYALLQGQIPMSSTDVQTQYAVIRWAIEQGVPCPIVMAKETPESHAVLAYKIIEISTPEVTAHQVYIYDNVYKGDDLKIIAIEERNGTWEFGSYGGYKRFFVINPFSPIAALAHDFPLLFTLYSPATLRITDPDGLTLDDDQSEIDGAYYRIIDTDADGHDEQLAIFLWPKDGRYSVQVIPKPDALPTDTYSLEVASDGETVVLAEDIPISDVPDKPYVIEWTETGINVAPIANAGDDQTVFTTIAGIAQVALNGSGSSDPDGDDLTYSWYLDGQKIATGVSPTIQLTAGVYVIDLVVSDGTADSQPDQVRVIVIQTVGVDIKPGSWPNTINLGSNGVIPVAILTTESFDATSVDPSTVQLEGLGVAVRGKSEKLLANEEDVDEDGDIDLVVKIETENLEPGAWQSGLVVLTGETYDGRAIEGCDEIIIVPPE